MTEGKVLKKINREPTRSANEFIKLFDYNNKNALYKDVAKGEFPEPDLTIGQMNNEAIRKCFWRLSTLKKEWLKRGKDIKEFIV
jgi:hypothetical protein